MKKYLYMSRWENHGGMPGLALFQFDTETGELEFLKHLDEIHSFGCSQIDREKNILYICNETNLVNETGFDTGRIYGFRLTPETGDLEELFHRETFCPWPDYVNFSADRKYMIVTHHSWATAITTIERNEAGEYYPAVRYMDSAVNLYAMNEDGTMGKLLDVKKHSFSSRTTDYEGRFTIPHPHCAVRSPSGKLFAVCDKGDGHVYLYTIDEEKQQLVLLSRTLTDEVLSEPRYCAFHPTKPYFFVNHEHSGHGKMMVSAFRYDEEGNLELINKVDCLPPEAKANCGQGFCISPDGKYLYNQLNGYNAMVVLEVDQQTGGITVKQRLAIRGEKPRSCALSPDGRFLLTTCLTGEVAVYAVGEDGCLTEAGHGAFLRGSAYITFL